jgi:nitrogen-specific signal transduction histidine kinase
LVETALSLANREIAEREVKVHLLLEPGIPEISVDRAQIEYAVEILVKNALNQMQRGTTLSISTSREKTMLKVAIRYPSRDISPQDVEQFFYPFTLTQMAYEIVDPHISKLLVDRHGGAIDVKVEEANHLLIEIALPFRREEEAE